MNGCKSLNSSNFGKEVKRTLGIDKFRGGSREHRIYMYAEMREQMDAEISNVDFWDKNEDY